MLFIICRIPVLITKDEKLCNIVPVVGCITQTNDFDISELLVGLCCGEIKVLHIA